jgi:hypothetical protein
MKQNTILTIIFSFLYFLCTNEQITEFREIDSLLTNNYRKLLSAEPELRYATLSSVFKNQSLKYLANPITFMNEFDMLSKYLTILTSPDKKIKFTSWDDLTGVTWHAINCIAQFETDNEKRMAQQINSGNEMESGGYTDSRIFKVFELNKDSKKLYLTIA